MDPTDKNSVLEQNKECKKGINLDSFAFRGKKSKTSDLFDQFIPKLDENLASADGATKKKQVKLNEDATHSDDSNDFLNALDELEKEHLDIQADERQKVLQSDENFFKVKSVLLFDQDLSSFNNILSDFGLLSEDMKLRCAIKILVLENHHSKIQSYYCVLSGTWVETEIDKGDEIQIFGKFWPEHQAILIKNSFDTSSSIYANHFAIVEPNILVNPTLISSSYPCYRKAIISDVFSGREDLSLAMTKGNIVHVIFENLATSVDLVYQTDKIELLLQNLIEQNLFVFYHLNCKVEEVVEDIRKLISTARKWIIDNLKSDKYLKFFKDDVEYKIKVLQIINSEQMINAPNLGIKGKLDLVMFCEIEYDNGQTISTRRAFIPFELKTGERELFSYNAQALLYSLLLMQKYKQYENINAILFYLKLDKLLDVKFKNFEVLTILMRRNKLAKYLKKFENSKYELELPNMLNNPHDCNRCFQAIYCSFSKLIHEGPARIPSTKKRLYSQRSIVDIEDVLVNSDFKVYHQLDASLDSNKRAYAKKWIKMIQIEEHYDNELKSNHEIDDPSFYLVTLENFENLRDAIKKENPQATESVVILKFTKHFDDKPSFCNFLDYFKLNESVSVIQSSLSCTLRGYLCEKKMKKVLEAEKKKYIAYLHVKFQAGDYVLNSEKLESINPNEIQTIWRINLQKRKFYPYMRANIVDLLTNPDVEKQKQLIVDLREPTFAESLNLNEKNIISKLDKKIFNEDQLHAIEKTLLAKDYNIILGMPGTGKTFVIAQMLKILMELGETVLLSSYTHSALDNILKRFIEQNPNLKSSVVRIASNTTQVDEKLHEFVFQKKNFKKVSEIQNFFESKKLYAVTCLACGNVALNKTKFDICIIDEASQALEPVAIGPILLAKKFVLIGDHYQLEPLVKSDEAYEKGMSKSLFQKLLDAYPNSISMLRYQYRMNEDIMLLSNKLIYENQLRLNDHLIAKSSIDIPFVEQILDKKWLLDIFNPERRVLFLNLDCITSLRNAIFKENRTTESQNLLPPLSKKDEPDMNSDIGSDNDSELSFADYQTQTQKYSGLEKLDLKVAVFLVQTLINCGVKPEDIGLITPLNFERNYLQSKLKKHKLDIYTVDKSQGTDKNCIVINLSLEKKSKDKLLTNPRRLNVAFTRAKQKLLVIGSIHNLQQIKNMDKFIEIIVAKRWVYNLEDKMVEQMREAIKLNELSNKATVQPKIFKK